MSHVHLVRNTKDWYVRIVTRIGTMVLCNDSSNLFASTRDSYVLSSSLISLVLCCDDDENVYLLLLQCDLPREQLLFLLLQLLVGFGHVVNLVPVHIICINLDPLVHIRDLCGNESKKFFGGCIEN
jgi:hypothetical protein